MSERHLKIEALRKVFTNQKTGNEVVAVADISVDIKKGELVTLLGPSGCGKTTVLRMIAGFETPTSGTITLNEKEVASLPPNKRNSSMVFQSYALFPHLNVQENIGYGLKLKRLSAKVRKEKLLKIIDLVGLHGYESRRPNELSGGQQQRVALARALVVEPEILLFDEPLSNLDAKLRESMRNEIRSLQQRLSITSVYVTHDQVEALAISDRIIVMNKGEIEQMGRPEEVYLRPQTPFVADFMGAANLIPAEVKSTSAQECVLELNGKQISFPWPCPDSPSGAQAYLVCRPENIQLHEKEGELSVKILERQYLGSAYEYITQTSLSQKLIIRLAANTCAKVFEARQEVFAKLSPKDCSLVFNFKNR